MKVKSRQTYYDIALEQYGSAEYAFDIAQANNKLPFDVAEGEIVLPDSIIANKSITNHYKTNKISPATDISNRLLSPIDEDNGGIGYMGIGINFIIS